MVGGEIRTYDVVVGGIHSFEQASRSPTTAKDYHCFLLRVKRHLRPWVPFALSNVVKDTSTTECCDESGSSNKLEEILPFRLPRRWGRRNRGLRSMDKFVLFQDGHNREALTLLDSVASVRLREESYMQRA